MSQPATEEELAKARAAVKNALSPHDLDLSHYADRLRGLLLEAFGQDTRLEANGTKVLVTLPNGHSLTLSL